MEHEKKLDNPFKLLYFENREGYDSVQPSLANPAVGHLFTGRDFLSKMTGIPEVDFFL